MLPRSHAGCHLPVTVHTTAPTTYPHRASCGLGACQFAGVPAHVPRPSTRLGSAPVRG